MSQLPEIGGSPYDPRRSGVLSNPLDSTRVVEISRHGDSALKVPT